MVVFLPIVGALLAFLVATDFNIPDDLFVPKEGGKPGETEFNSDYDGTPIATFGALLLSTLGITFPLGLLLIPFYRARETRLFMNAASLGSVHLSSTLEARQFYWPYFVYLLSVIGFVLILGLVIGGGDLLLQTQGMESGFHWMLVLGMVFGYLGGALFFAVLYVRVITGAALGGGRHHHGGRECRRPRCRARVEPARGQRPQRGPRRRAGCRRRPRSGVLVPAQAVHGTYYDGLSARAHPVTLVLEDRLEITGQDLRLAWTLAELSAGDTAAPLMRVGPAGRAERVEFTDEALAAALKDRCPDLYRSDPSASGGRLRLVLWSDRGRDLGDRSGDLRRPGHRGASGARRPGSDRSAGSAGRWTGRSARFSATRRSAAMPRRGPSSTA